MAKQIFQSPEFAVSQLLQVNNLFLDQVKKFDAEIDYILEAMKSLVNK